MIAGASGLDHRRNLCVNVPVASQQGRRSENHDLRHPIAHGSIISTIQLNFSRSQRKEKGEGGGRADTRITRVSFVVCCSGAAKATRKRSRTANFSSRVQELI